jgi:hypothetical protein
MAAFGKIHFPSARPAHDRGGIARLRPEDLAYPQEGVVGSSAAEGGMIPYRIIRRVRSLWRRTTQHASTRQPVLEVRLQLLILGKLLG